MLLGEQRIDETLIRPLLGWRHSGFSPHNACGLGPRTARAAGPFRSISSARRSRWRSSGTTLGLWPAPAHSPPVAGYPLPSARHRVAPRDQGVRPGHAKASRRRPRAPGFARPCPRASVFPLDSRLRSTGYSPPSHEGASREPWHPANMHNPVLMEVGHD